MLPTGPKLARFAVSLLLLTTLQAGAEPVETPERFVRRVYARYHAQGPGVAMSRPDGAAFYTEALLDAFAKDQAGARGEGVAIDWDPICDCQDYELRLKTLTVTKDDADAVKARVDFANLGSRKTVLLTLSQTPAGWRIADVGDKDVKSIMALLKAALVSPASSKPSGSASPKP